MAKVNHDDIIDAAIELFNQNGYHATSMRDIARAIDIKKPSLYHHFESKEAILRTILEAGMNQLLEELEAIVASSGGCEEKLHEAVRAHARIIAQNPKGAAVFMREDRGLGEAYLEDYVARRDRVEALYRLMLQDCITEDVFRPTDVAITVQAMLGMVNWMTRWYRPEGRLSADEIAKIFSDLLLEGLRNPDG